MKDMSTVICFSNEIGKKIAADSAAIFLPIFQLWRQGFHLPLENKIFHPE